MVNIFSPTITPRLHYVLGVIFRDHLRTPYLVTSDKESWLLLPDPKINYSGESLPESLQIRPSGILEERFAPGRAPRADGMKGAAIESRRGAGAGAKKGPTEHLTTGPAPVGPRTASPTNGQKAHRLWPFDLFGAVFYLLSRYEEYVSTAAFDPMGRFEPTHSWAYQHGLLERPIIDEWLQTLGSAVDLPQPGFRFSPTYDIDQPWSYRHKGVIASVLSASKSLLTGKWGRLIEQGKVVARALPDPFDNFDWLDELHNSTPTEPPIYFFPVSLSRNTYDKGPPPGKEAYQSVIRSHSHRYPIGVHPSYFSTTKPDLLNKEVAILGRITGLPVTISRFHYIRFRLPEGYRLLLEAGIRADYSMGYGEMNGFRASYSRPFPWYDLENEKETSLQVVPFCWMDSTCYYNQAFDGPAALADLNGYAQVLKAAGGRLTMVWHNSSLGVHKRWMGWRSVYQRFLNDIVP